MFEDVDFGYPPKGDDELRLILRDVNLVVEPATTVALVGRSGAGKTTIASLIPRFYEPTSGRITIDGIDISTVTLKSLRDNIGIVPQDAVLFTASIRENVQYGRPGAPDAMVWDALEQANIRDFVESLPDQLDTMIGEEGIRPSTGQRQRIALARVFLKNPPILILDEATSGLDSEVENLIHDAVRRLMRGRTSFLIAHRLASAVEADVIIACDQGRIVESGIAFAVARAKRRLCATLQRADTQADPVRADRSASRVIARGTNRIRHSGENWHLKFSGRHSRSPSPIVRYHRLKFLNFIRSVRRCRV